MALKDQNLTFAIKGRTIFVSISCQPADIYTTAVVGSSDRQLKNRSERFDLKDTTVTVSGRVTDENGAPLPGANVKVKGTNVGTTTDNQGRFTLTNVDGNGILEISFVGYDTHLFSVKGKTFLDVTLQTKITAMQEVVINKGYYTETKKFSTGNVGTVTCKEIEKQPINNPLL